MINVQVQGLDKTLANLAGMQKQVRFATAVALTRTAKIAQQDAAREFSARFDRPTPTVMKGLWTKPATRDNLAAMVYVKDRPLGGKNPNSLAQVLAHQFSGGGRIAKQLELVLRRDGFLGGDEFVVPGAAAKLDRYGNMSRGQIVQILSQIGVRSAGYDSSPTGSKRSRRNVSRAGVIFWSRGAQGVRTPLTDKATGIIYGFKGGSASHLAKGAWMRTAQGPRPLLIAIRAPGYRKRIDLAGIVQRAVDRNWSREFDRALADAMRTAR